MKLSGLPAVCACICCILCLSACGRSHQGFEAQRQQDDLTSLPRPEGVDPKVWEQLKAALATAIAQHAGTHGTSDVPDIPQSKVTDFALQSMDASGATFTWSFRSQGDYDQNGEVNVSDLSPLGLYFNKDHNSPDWAKAQPADGNYDGAVSIADVTPIGVNLHIGLDGYEIQQSSTPTDESSWVEALSVPILNGEVPSAGGYRQYSEVVTNVVGGSFYRLVPYQGDGAARIHGVPSDAVMTADFQPPTGVSATSGVYGDKVVVSWEPATDATGYEVYRDAQDAAVDTTDAATTSWNDTTLTDFAPHTYWVKALYASGTSSFSIEASGYRAQRGDWWMFGHDNRHSHRSSFNGPQTNDLTWAHSFAGASFTTSSPSIGADGTIYIGSDDGSLLALNSDGSQKWKYAADSAVDAAPAIGADGTIYIASDGFPGSLTAVTPAGSLAWSYPLPDGALGSPAVGPDGTIYVGGFDGILYAISPTGLLHWGKPLTPSTFVVGGPVVDSTGNIYVGDYAGYVWSIDKDGNTNWSQNTAGSIFSSASLSDDETVLYVGTSNGVLHAINTGSGKERWNYPTSGIGFSETPAIGADGNIYIGDQGGAFWRINSNGTLGWTKQLSVAALTDAAIGTDGKIYVGSSGSLEYALDPASGNILWSRTTESAITGNQTIGPNGELYVPTFGGYLLNFGPSSADPPAKPTELKASQGTIYQAIRLSWNFAYDATGYEVYKDGGGTPVATLGAVTEWRDTPVADSDPHSYTIKATNGNGTSPASAGATGTASNNPPGPGDWSMFGHDAARTRHSTLNGPVVKPAFWTYPTLGAIYASPTVGANGEIYIGSDDGSLYCLGSDGTKLWSALLGSPVESSAAIGSDGTIYVGTGSGTLYAINPDGSPKWNYPTGTNIYSSPAIDNGLIYFGNGDGVLYALHPDGSLAWSYDVGLLIISSPAIGSDGVVYVGNGEDNQLIAVKSDGSGEKWHFDANGAVRATATVLRDQINGDKIYVGSMSNRMYCINADGSEAWHYDAGDFIFSSAALDTDGSTYFGCADGLLYALKPNGSLRWSFDVAAPIYSSPVLAADGRIFVGDSGGFLDVVTPGGQYSWWISTSGAVEDSSPAIGPGGMVYLADEFGYIYGFGP